MCARLLVVVLLLLGSAGPVLATGASDLGASDLGASDLGASDLGETARLAIRSVIERQLAAFQRDDGAEAFSYASPTIQRKFQSPDFFMAMVRGGYRAVYRPRTVEFRALRVIDGVPTQEVLFVGPDKRTVTALYEMERQPDGSWKINGVYLVKAPDAAA